MDGSTRRRAALLGLPIILLLCFVLVRWTKEEKSAPRFKRFEGSHTIESYQYVIYDILSTAPFRDGKMWIAAWNKTNSPVWHCYLFDMNQRQVMGELIGGNPIFPTFLNGDQATFLCSTRKSRNKLTLLLETFKANLLNKYPLPAAEEQESYWLVDLSKGSAKLVGEVGQMKGAGSSQSPSPNFRHSFMRPTGSFSRSTLTILDLEQAQISEISFKGQPMGWWDNSHIISKVPGDDFVLYDLVSNRSTPFLNHTNLSALFQKANLTNLSASAYLFPEWNGSNYDFYLTDTHRKWQGTNSFLAKLDRSKTNLEMMANDFKFGWSDHLNARGDLYLYSGRDAGKDSDGVWLRDLRTGETHIIIAPTTNRFFSTPRFRGENLIFIRSNNTIWQTDVHGSNARRLFPP